MTLQEAIKSGKRFRRPAVVANMWYPNPASDGYFEYADILADDWEIDEPKVEITRSQLITTLSQLPYQSDYLRGRNEVFWKTLANDLAERLGL